MAKRYTTEEKAEHLTAWIASGLNASRYAREAGLCLGSLLRWQAAASALINQERTHSTHTTAPAKPQFIELVPMRDQRCGHGGLPGHQSVQHDSPESTGVTGGQQQASSQWSLELTLPGGIVLGLRGHVGHAAV